MGKHGRPRGPNQRAVRRGGWRENQIGPSAPRLQGGPDITNPAGEKGGAGLTQLQHDPRRAREAAAGAAAAASTLAAGTVGSR